jgi:hypothetical protein
LISKSTVTNGAESRELSGSTASDLRFSHRLELRFELRGRFRLVWKNEEKIFHVLRRLYMYPVLLTLSSSIAIVKGVRGEQRAASPSSQRRVSCRYFTSSWLRPHFVLETCNSQVHLPSLGHLLNPGTQDAHQVRHCHCLTAVNILILR